MFAPGVLALIVEVHSVAEGLAEPVEQTLVLSQTKAGFLVRIEVVKQSKASLRLESLGKDLINVKRGGIALLGGQFGDDSRFEVVLHLSSGITDDGTAGCEDEVEQSLAKCGLSDDARVLVRQDEVPQAVLLEDSLEHLSLDLGLRALLALEEPLLRALYVFLL